MDQAGEAGPNEAPAGPNEAPAGPTNALGPRPAAGSFEAFYRHEYPAIVAFAYVLCGRGGTAEDIAQDAFVVTHRRWDRVGTYDKPEAFVRRVVVNMSVSQRRRLAAEGRAVARMALGIRPATDELGAPDDDFWQAVRSLPARQAQSLALHYLEDRSAEDIAAILGCAPPTVRVHLHRGRLALEQMLAERRTS